MGLAEYRKKRDFGLTKEPRGTLERRAGASFVVQKHAASRLHYDFRLELDGVLLSWAVPKGPSLDPSVKRLAVQTEDHPVAYGGFEGVIPKGEYGGGSVVVWDQGSWTPEGDAREMYRKGRLNFALSGQKLQGSFHLVKTRGRGGKGADRQWLLIKSDDAAAKRGSDDAIVVDEPDSVVTGRSVEDVAKNPDKVWKSNRANKVTKEAATERAATPRPRAAPAKARPKGTSTKKITRSRAAPRPLERLASARRAKAPDFVEPELATLVDAAPAGDDFLHEIKLDGYRILAHVARGKVTLRSRRGNDWTARLPAIAAAVAELPLTNGVLDGEVVVLGADGVSDFQLLQNSMEVGKDGACVYYVFDVPFLDSRDLRKVPLLERKQLLAETVGSQKDGVVRLSEHVVGGGPAFFTHACKLGLEGIVSKKCDSAYVSGRTRSWLKIKGSSRQEFVIGGYTEPAGARGHFGALLLGVQEGNELVYAGKVGTGFSAESLREIKKRMAKLERKTSPFDEPPRGAEARGVHWLAPSLVAEIEFAERTHDGKVRHASFRGLRDDKEPSAVVAEKAEAKAEEKTDAPSLKIRLTHPERVLYPEAGITKQDLALYYTRVASWMLPHVTGRPLMIVRCPEGASKQCFYQKHASRGMPSAVHTVDVREKADKKAAEPHLRVDDLEGLVSLVQMGALEIHTWGCKAEALDTPDQLVFDLDPDESLPWARIADAARSLRADLKELGLTGFVKTTGGKGLHIVVPIVPEASWTEAKAFSKRVVAARVKAEPARYLAVMTKEKRKGKIFLDYLRNGRGATSVCAFSSRAKAQALVSAPLDWKEIDVDERPVFDVQTLPERLDSLAADPWADFDAARAPMPQE
jgi:bifunctional non-homologous end joining protein LigD